MRYYDKNDFLNIAYNIAYYTRKGWDGKGVYSQEGLGGGRLIITNLGGHQLYGSNLGLDWFIGLAFLRLT